MYTASVIFDYDHCRDKELSYTEAFGVMNDMNDYDIFYTNQILYHKSKGLSAL